jgi:myo-inositol-1(or 4)-monophosphatase
LLSADPSQLQIEMKGPQDFVSNADRAVEQLIVQRLSAAFPTDSFLGEEGGRDKADDLGMALWVIDPIDGTANFIRGRAEWCVSIGFLLEGRPAIGVIYHPGSDELFSAAAGRGARCNGTPIRASERSSIGDATIAFEYSLKTRPHDFLDPLGRILSHGGEFRRNGSAALSLAYVADGRLDGFVELHIYSWDILAGMVLVAEAGGWTSDFFGEGDVATGRSFIAAAPGIRSELLKLTNSISADSDEIQTAGELRPVLGNRERIPPLRKSMASRQSRKL